VRCSARGAPKHRCELVAGHDGWHRATLPDGLRVTWGPMVGDGMSMLRGNIKIMGGRNA
jgi:hypothetical protein